MKKGDYEVLTEDGYLHIIEERIEIDTVKEEIRFISQKRGITMNKKFYATK